MENYNTIELKEFEVKPFQILDDEWMLVTSAKRDSTVNTMTASWGGFGIMWNKSVTSIAVRPQRFTKEFIDDSKCYSLSFFGESYRKELAYLGKVSGKNENKIENTKLEIAFHNNIPYFKEASRMLFCRVLAEQTVPEKCFWDTSLIPQFYADNDYHHLYFAEVLEILEKKN